MGHTRVDGDPISADALAPLGGPRRGPLVVGARLRVVDVMRPHRPNEVVSWSAPDDARARTIMQKPHQLLL